MAASQRSRAFRFYIPLKIKSLKVFETFRDFAEIRCALHLPVPVRVKDALHIGSNQYAGLAKQTRTATHPKADAMQFYLINPTTQILPGRSADIRVRRPS
jgi:hypothetical protein